MKLRQLKKEDAPYMLEWMHDDYVIHYMKTNFKDKTIGDCINFIESATLEKNLHLAIVDDNDVYMGTVSLKHICNGTAEFGITIRRCAMGTGLSNESMKEMLNIGFKQYNLKEIYWCVDPQNTRAIMFYNKSGYKQFKKEQLADGYTEYEMKKYVWYHTFSEQCLTGMNNA